jgi:hypothetical protein
MRKFGIAALCLLATFAIGATAASSASAATYRWCARANPKKSGAFSESKCATAATKGEYEKVAITPCKFVGKNGGYYSDSACTTLVEKRGEPAKKGEYEKECPPFNGNALLNKINECAFTDTSGAAEVVVPAIGTSRVVCEASASDGEYTSDDTSLERITFTGCSFQGFPCESGGPNSEPSGHAGTIVANELEGTIKGEGQSAGGSEGKIVPAGDVWVNLVSVQHAPYWTEFNCAGFLFMRVEGTLAAPMTGGSLNHLSTASALALEGGEGEQALSAEAFDVEESRWSGPLGATLEAGVDRFSSVTEIEVQT